MKTDLEVIHSDRCMQLARHVSAAMTLSEVSPVEAVEMALLAAQKWFAAKPDGDSASGKLMLAGIALAIAAADRRHLRKSEAALVRAVESALAPFRKRRRRGARKPKRR